MTSAGELPTVLQMVLGLYGYLLPLLLYGLWTTLALWDLGRREGITGGALWGWCATIYLLPLVGALGYLLFGGSRSISHLKLASIGGGIGLYVVVLILGHLVGGIA